jgi:FAD/FMN-containing dehydrogenase
MSTTTLPAAESAAVLGLASELRELLGPRRVTIEIRAREKASLDGSEMSPVLSAQYPLGLADLVAFPHSAEQIAVVVAAAVRHGVPITTRGKGTGNYGQAIPMHGGLVLDTTKCAQVVEVKDGLMTAEAGTRMIVMETAARETGQQLWMYPSTAQSTIGGFLGGGSGGTGTIKHGSNWQGFVAALDVVHATPQAELIHVEGEEAVPYVHSYGVGGVIARATVRLEPLQDWRCMYASFEDHHAAFTVLRQIRALEPVPRLVSADPVEIVNTLPDDPGMPRNRASLRAILDGRTVLKAIRLVEQAGGRVEDVREGSQAPLALSMLSYNHGVWWLLQRDPGEWFHMEVSGEALIDRIDEVHAALPGGLLHLEAGHTIPIGMLAARYRDPAQIYEAMELLGELGVGTHNPHQWYVDRNVDDVRALSQRTDPLGLLNPGKWKDEAPSGPWWGGE